MGLPCIRAEAGLLAWTSVSFRTDYREGLQRLAAAPILLSSPPAERPEPTMSDSGYLARRAEQEAYLAMAATNPKVVAAHYRMSSAYLERLHARTETAEQVQGAPR